MNQVLGAMTNYGKSWGTQAFIERNMDEFDGLVIADYKDEYGGLVEEFDVSRLTVVPGAEGIDADQWGRTLDETPRIQLARAGQTAENWRETIATVVQALSEADGTWLVAIDEAHKVAPQSGKCPGPIETLATTWHGDGMGVLYVTQRFAKLEETILAECQASLLGAFRSTADLDKIESVEYPVEIHQADASEVAQPLPDELLVDGEPLTLRRFSDDEDLTIGSEWIYSDDTTLRRLDSREWDLQSTHYGSDRVRIKQPFEGGSDG